MIYLDNAATTKPCIEAAEAMSRALTDCWGNPSATHAPGRAAKKLLDESRKQVMEALGAKNGTLLFTSGGTEADNQAVKCAAALMKHRGNHIISSMAEHEAILNSLASLKSQGWEVTLLKPDEYGRIPVDSVAGALREDTVLVSLMLVNNETGGVTDIPGVRKLLTERKSAALLHTDAVQAFMKIPFTVKTLGADLITVSSHKINGPKGVGALWMRDELRLPPLLHGGGQEQNYRSGTEATPAIAGFGAAAKAYRLWAQQNDLLLHYGKLRGMVSELLPDAVLIGRDSDACAGHVCCVAFPGCRAEVLQNALDAEGICVSRGSACAKGRRSHVLESMELPAGVIDGALRVSFGRDTTEADVRAFCERVLAVKQRFFRN